MKLRNYLYKSYLEQDEKIQFVMHKHIIIESKRFFKIAFFGILIPLSAWWLFPEVKFFAITWLSIGVVRFVYEFFDWYYDVWLVTDRSIIQIIWEGIFNKSSARIEYHIIQLIGYEVKGFAPTFFNYGNVILELVTGNPAIFEGAFRAKRKAELLTRAQEEFVTNKSFRDHRALQGVLTDMLQHHIMTHGVSLEQQEEE